MDILDEVVQALRKITQDPKLTTTTNIPYSAAESLLHDEGVYIFPQYRSLLTNPAAVGRYLLLYNSFMKVKEKMVETLDSIKLPDNISYVIEDDFDCIIRFMDKEDGDSFHALTVRFLLTEDKVVYKLQGAHRCSWDITLPQIIALLTKKGFVKEKYSATAITDFLQILPKRGFWARCWNFLTRLVRKKTE